jgi:hypothetical protein
MTQENLFLIRSRMLVIGLIWTIKMVLPLINIRETIECNLSVILVIKLYLCFVQSIFENLSARWVYSAK